MASCVRNLATVRYPCPLRLRMRQHMGNDSGEIVEKSDGPDCFVNANLNDCVQSVARTDSPYPRCDSKDPEIYQKAPVQHGLPNVRRIYGSGAHWSRAQICGTLGQLNCGQLEWQKFRLTFPWHCLYFFPDPHGQGAFLPTLCHVEGSSGSTPTGKPAAGWQRLPLQQLPAAAAAGAAAGFEWIMASSSSGTFSARRC